MTRIRNVYVTRVRQETGSYISITLVKTGVSNVSEYREDMCAYRSERETETQVTDKNENHSHVTQESNSREQITFVNLSETKVNNDC